MTTPTIKAVQWAGEKWTLVDVPDTRPPMSPRPVKPQPGLDEIGCLLGIGAYCATLPPQKRRRWAAERAASYCVGARARWQHERWELTEEVDAAIFAVAARHYARVTGEELTRAMIHAVRDEKWKPAAGPCVAEPLLKPAGTHS